MATDGKNVALLAPESAESVFRKPTITKPSVDRAHLPARPVAVRRPVVPVKSVPKPLALKLAHAVGIGTLVALGILMVLAHGYYESPIAGRVRNPWHEWLRPSGAIGQALGLYAFGLFLFLLTSFQCLDSSGCVDLKPSASIIKPRRNSGVVVLSAGR